MNNKTEVLAPAGSMEILRTAVQAGADAIYVGGTKFGARAYADNFDETALLQAIEYAHIHGKRLYLTVNTLLLPDETGQLYNFLKAPYEAGLDAVIVQDTGAADYISRQFPKLSLHASTQMTITNPVSAALLRELGVKRIVPARELSEREICDLKRETGMEIEVFVHGALCYCYSGQCLLSSMIGGRSGNRGRCAQPCRLPYMVEDKTYVTGDHNGRYLLSPKDLCALHALPNLIACGVDSLKIEGRMKNSSYVAQAVSAYRQAVDAIAAGCYTDELQAKLQRQMADIYNRGGFTEGYFTKHNGIDMMSMTKPNHFGVFVGEVTRISNGMIYFTAAADISKGDVVEVSLVDGDVMSLTVPEIFKQGEEVCLNAAKTKQIKLHTKLYRTKNQVLLTQLKTDYLDADKKEKIKIEVIIKKDLCATIKMSFANVSATVKGNIVSAAKNKPITKDVIMDKVTKLGNTPFIACDVDIVLDENVFFPLSEFNELKRLAADALKDNICKTYQREPVNHIQTTHLAGKGDFILSGDKQPVISVFTDRVELLPQVLANKQVSCIYLDTVLMSEQNAVAAADMAVQSGRQLIICMPHIFRKEVMQRFAALLKQISFYDGLLVRTFDEFAWAIRYVPGKQIIGDASLYAYNAQAVEYYKKYVQDM